MPLHHLKRFAKTRPLSTQVFLSTGLAAIGDYHMQKTVEKRDRLDLRRSAVFVGFGIFNGLLSYYVYVTCMSRLFPAATAFAEKSWAAKVSDVAGLRDLTKQCAVDLFVYTPLVYFPIFYTFKAAFQGDEFPSEWNRETFTRAPAVAANMYLKNGFDDMKLNLSVWIPGDVVCFAVPLWLRMPACHMFNLAWICFLSGSRGGEVAKSEPKVFRSSAAVSTCIDRREVKEEAGLAPGPRPLPA